MAPYAFCGRSRRIRMSSSCCRSALGMDHGCVHAQRIGVCTTGRRNCSVLKPAKERAAHGGRRVRPQRSSIRHCIWRIHVLFVGLFVHLVCGVKNAAAHTRRHVQMPELLDTLRHMLPSLPFFFDLQHSLAGYGGDGRCTYFLVYCRLQRLLLLRDL